MPKKNISKRMRGGWPWDKKESSSDGSSDGTGMWDSLTKGASSATGTASSWFSSDTPDTNTPTNSYPITGGRRRRRKSHRMRGGYSDNMSMTNLASRAAPFSGETVRAQAYVGGKKTKKRCHKNKRSNRRHCRK